ncbi:MAG TPA: polysaccharide deacetylase family protein, partial [Chitinophagaceae bacterium]|nr:polysaccharide deacetylase family protein [Chitinophagaceae bacterium]
PEVTSRLNYIINLISRELFKEPAAITTDIDAYNRYDGPRINYSSHRLNDSEFFIQSTPLLFEKGIRAQPVGCFEQEGYRAFFKNEGNMGFDILAASFYLVSRYEEYLPHAKDEYGRYAHTNSLAYKEGFLNTPLVNTWLQDMKRLLKEKFPGLYFNYKDFRFLATYDIDIAYSYLYKGWWRNLGGALRSLWKGQFRLLAERINVLRGKQKDPFDSYEWLDALHLYCRPRSYYFFLVTDKRGTYDKNIRPEHPAMQKLINYHANGYTIGLHPSWQSGDKELLLREEKEMLEYITGKDIIHSRQHYIRFTLPEAFRQLIKAGVQKDFSMGYGSINGFRASIASSFYWYDLEREEETPLKLYPFCFMDSNAFFEQKLAPQQAFDEMMHYYYAVKKVNGLLITIWHNSILGADPQFKGWREVYEIFLKEEIYWDR